MIDVTPFWPRGPLFPSGLSHVVKTRMTAVSAHPGPGKYSSPTWLRWSYSTLLVTSALLAVPYHALEYALVPSRKPRQSWSTTEAVLVVFLRRAGRMTEHGMQHGVRDPRDEPRSSSLKETVFRWVPRLKDDLLKGALVDDFVKPLHPIGTYIWGRKHARPDRKRRGKVGLYLHGGGYAHFSAHEESQTSSECRHFAQVASLMPSPLRRDSAAFEQGRGPSLPNCDAHTDMQLQMSVFREIHAVEYRMLPNPFPAALQDVAAVFAHLVDVDNVDPSDIVFIGDSAGGNLALALAMWIRDEGLYAPPSGLLLLSVSPVFAGRSLSVC